LILDAIGNYKIYCPISNAIKKSLEFLYKGDFREMKPGRYDLEDGIYYMIQELLSRPEEEALFEAHRKYIDIQYVISGNELHGYAPLSKLKIQDAYNEEKDVAFYNGTGSVFSLPPGSFVIYFPNDAHKPDLVIEKPSMVKKIVVKMHV